MDLYQKLKGCTQTHMSSCPVSLLILPIPVPRAELGLVPAQEHSPGLWNKMFMRRKALGCDFREPFRKCCISFQSMSCPKEDQALLVKPQHNSCCPPKPGFGCFGFSQASPEPGQMGTFPVCLLLWIWGSNTQFVTQVLDVELQVLFPWRDSKDTAGNMSGILGSWVPSLAQLPRGLASGEAPFIQELSTYLFSLFRI